MDNAGAMMVVGDEAAADNKQDMKNAHQEEEGEIAVQSPPLLDLHLQPPTSTALRKDSTDRDDGIDDDGRSHRKIALQKVEETLRELLMGTQAGRSEARMWLYTAAAGLEDSLGVTVQREEMRRLLPGPGRRCQEAREAFARHLVQLLCEVRPGQVGAAIADHPTLLKDFFLGSPSAVQLWFGQFSMAGTSQFRYGAKGLARFSLTHRNEVWHHLVWEGKHPQAPVAVASKPHYFCELAVVPSVRGLLLDCPGFLESEELRECISTGDIFAIDYDHFTKVLHRAYEDGGALARSMADIMDQFLQEADFKTLCQKLLHLLEPRDLLNVLNDLLPRQLPLSRVPPELLVFGCSSWRELDDMILYSAIGSAAPHTAAILSEEENRSLAATMKQLCLSLREPQASKAFWPCLVSQADRSSRRHLLSQLLLEAWVQRCSLDLHLRCSEEQGPATLAKLLGENGVECKNMEIPQTCGKQERYELLEPIKTKKTRRSRKHKEDKKSSKKKSKKHKRSKRRRSSSGSSSDNLLGFGGSRAMTSDEEGDSAAAGTSLNRIGVPSGGASLAADAMMRIRFPVPGPNRKPPESVQVRFAEAVDFVCGQSLRFWLQALNAEISR